MSDPRTIAVLCAQRRSVYHRMLGVDVYDIDRDARTFPGVIAHPPCRAWSKHCAHQAKPDPGEKELGIWCAQQVKKWGGISSSSQLVPVSGTRPDSLIRESIWRAGPCGQRACGRLGGVIPCEKPLGFSSPRLIHLM
jgi:hypothetical protein